MERKSFEGADFSGVAQAAQESQAAMESTQALEDKLSQEQAEEQSIQDQFASEQQDPRNAENWGLGGVVKEVQSAIGGGIQDTASSAVTLGERILDTATGEIQRESQTEAGYDTEWDDWFVDDANPIETKTWWGGLLRSATHFGTMGAAIVAAAPAAGAAGTALGAGRAVSAIGGLAANQWARAAMVGAGTDLVSKYSQDANALQVLRDKYGFIDTPLTTNDMDHPVVKTLKNVVEGMGIGEIANGVFRIMGKGVRHIRSGDRLGEQVIRDGTEEALSKGELRTQSVNDQVIEKGQLELFETPEEFRGHKNGPISDTFQGSPTSKDNVVDVRNSQKRIRDEMGAEDGSPGSVTTPTQLEIASRSNGLSEEVVTDVYRELVSEPRFEAEIEAIRNGRTSMKEVWGDAVEQFMRTGLGREAAEQSASEYLTEYFQDAHRYFADSPDEMVAWSAKNVVAGDLLVGSLLREIRDLGIAGRELFDIADLGDIDGPAKALFDKIITATTEIKRAKIIQSADFRELPPGQSRKQYVAENLEREVKDSIDGFRLALQIAGDSADDNLFKAVFETVSMNKDIHNLTDFDAWVRRKLKGGELNGKTQNSLLIKELQGVMVNSILSGPKTPVRAILGTSSATFMRPLATAVGAGLRLPFTGDSTTLRSSLAAANAMRESIPEAWQLFKSRLNSYWAGDIATVKSRYSEYTRGDEQWKVMGDWIENSGRATDGDRAAYYIANTARQLNDNKYLTYSTKIMAATDDTFGYILSRAKAREKAVREALDGANPGQSIDIDASVLKNAEDRFLNEITDADGNILDTNVEFAKREATLTTDLTGFSKGLNEVFNSTPWAKPFFLFARTGVNGLALTAKHTPGFNFLVKEWNDIAWADVSDLSSVRKYGINDAQDLINAKALQTGRLAIGSSVIMMAGQHFMNGGLTGNGPTDRSKRQVWMDAGWHPRSINIGGVWVGYDSIEPFNQILAGVADIGDHSELMGEEWTKDQFQKLSLVVMQAASSKSYLQGLQQFVDILAGQPGPQGRAVSALLNNTVPLAGLRNDIGKIFTPHMKELNSGWQDSIRNRNLLSENLSPTPLAVKYDILNGQPIREHDFPTRMWNALIPISLNLDHSPGRRLLFDSGYDLRLSTYYGPDGTDLSKSPRLRSEFQKYIGLQNIELSLNKLAADPRIQQSLAQMQEDLRKGIKDQDPMKAYHHNKMIQRLFTNARRKAWAKMKLDPRVQELMIADQERKVREKRTLRQTQSVEQILSISK